MEASGTDVVVRPYRTEDADELTTAGNDALIHRFVPSMPNPYTRHDALAWISQSTPLGQDGRFSYCFADPATGRLLGGGGFRRETELTAEVGYWVASWARGRGVATSATRLLTSYAFGQGVQRIILRTEWENAASQRVAIAAGYSREGVQRDGGANRDGSRHDLLVWARLHTDLDQPTMRVLPDLPGRSGSSRGELTDGVVTLRPLGVQDTDDTYELRALPEVVASSVPPLVRDRDTIADACARAEAGWLAGERAAMTILDTATSEYAGEIGLYYFDRVTQQAMLGYSMRPEWRGRGYAGRAVRLVSTWAFEVVGVARVVAGTAPQNLASQRVLEKAGFTREGYERSRLPGPDGTRIDNLSYALVP